MTLQDAMDTIRNDETFQGLAWCIRELTQMAGATPSQAEEVIETLLTSQATAMRLGFWRGVKQSKWS